jgi:phospholipase/carboxylesterase
MRDSIMQELDYIELEPTGRASASVIWLHGLGADGNDFVPIVPELDLPDSLDIRFIFPHAPVRPVTINGGMRMRAWYDILAIERGAREDDAGIRESQSLVEQLMAAEKARGIAADRIVVAGFSQGGAIALQTGLRHAERLGGILALSTYLPLRESLAKEAAAPNKSVPIFMAHGQYDHMIPEPLGAYSRDQLAAQGYSVDWHAYPMEHQVCLEEIRDIGAWLVKVLGPRIILPR